jgi:hypothetical protein
MSIDRRCRWSSVRAIYRTNVFRIVEMLRGLIESADAQVASLFKSAAP